MEYDSKIGAYVIINVPETYFGNGFYIRMSFDNRWMISTTFESGWRVAFRSEIPTKLIKYKKGKYKKTKKNKKYKYGDNQGEDED